MQNLCNQLRTIIPSVILFIIGILFCCSVAIGITGLSVIIGIILILTGCLLIINSLLKQKNIINYTGIISVGLIAFGIVFISNHLAGIIFLFIPWFLIILGIFFVIDIILNKIIKDNLNLTNLILRIILAIICLALGFCLKFINGFIEYSSIILGVLMIAVSLYLIISLFINNKK